MKDRQTYFWMLAAVISGMMFLGLSLSEDRSPIITKIQLAEPTVEVKSDALVQPAAAEIDFAATPLKRTKRNRVRTALYETTVDPNQEDGVIRDSKVQLCQGAACGCTSGCAQCGTVGTAVYSAPVHAGFGGGFVQTAGAVNGQQQLPSKALFAGDRNTPGRLTPRWRNTDFKAWEQYAYGEYIGPARTPHVPEYRSRVGDQLEFVYIVTRRRTNSPYRLNVGDRILVSSATDSALNQPTVLILSDGTIQLPLIGTVRASGKTIENIERELNDRYTEFVKSPEIIIQVIESDTPLRDLLTSVDARAGQGGQTRLATVSPDGTIQLPLIGSVPAIGLTLEEIGREVNARYRLYLGGIIVTPVLVERAPRFIYVVGEVGQSGQFELTGPTSVIQALALAEGFEEGANLRQVIVFRRDANWQLIATKLDLNGALNGRRPHPADEIWLRDSDIVLVPREPIQRLSEAVNQYLTSTLFAIFPQQAVQFGFDGLDTL